MAGYIYAITHLPTGRQYIGQSASSHRWHVHQAQLRAGKHIRPPLQAAWDADGPDAFTFQILEAVDDPADLRKREEDWVDARHAAGMPLFNAKPTPMAPEDRASHRAWWARVTGATDGGLYLEVSDGPGVTWEMPAREAVKAICGGLLCIRGDDGQWRTWRLAWGDTEMESESVYGPVARWRCRDT